MRKVKFCVGTNKIGSEISNIFEFDEDVSDEDIESCCSEWVWENIYSGWEEVYD